MLAPPKGGNFAPSGHFCPERPHITALAVVLLPSTVKSHTAAYSGVHGGTLRAPLLCCRSECSAQLFGSCLCPLPFHGLPRLLHLALVTEGEGILNRQDGVPETAVALASVSGDDLRAFCADETIFQISVRISELCFLYLASKTLFID